MDEDLLTMTREQLIDEVRKLRKGIREHRDSSEHELCSRVAGIYAGLCPLPSIAGQAITRCAAYR